MKRGNTDKPENMKRREYRMDRKKKIGLVVEGGGMKCAYNAGILDGFLDHGILFDYCIGVSGGAGNAASYVAGQRGGISVFLQSISIPRSISASGAFLRQAICSAFSIYTEN